MKHAFDVIIVGGGMVGLATACALAQQTSLSIAVLEASEKQSEPALQEYHHRVSAISLASKRIFSSIGVWQAIQEKRVSPFEQICVWDAVGKSEIQFDSREVAEPVLGYIIENNVIQAALEDKLNTLTNVMYFSSIELSDYVEKENGIALTAADGRVFEAKLMVAADGAHSWLRNQAGISVNKNDYEQLGIVAMVTSEMPHHKTARQVFLPSGPLAFLPLAESNLSSIVWSVPKEKAKALLSLDDEVFRKSLAEAFEYRLGEVLECSQRFAFPLYQQQAASYVKSRIALVGDAAHVMHPLAGQGVNTGLLDAASLVEVVARAWKKGRDFSSYASLRQYERWRKADNQQMMLGVDWIKKLFANEKRSAIQLRNVGLSMTNQMNVLKNIFVRHAVGKRNGLPAMATQNY